VTWVWHHLLLMCQQQYRVTKQPDTNVSSRQLSNAVSSSLLYLYLASHSLCQCFRHRAYDGVPEVVDCAVGLVEIRNMMVRHGTQLDRFGPQCA
jgi:hypothetical protein